ncbi:MAG: hypothetical protein RRY21_06910, partial [Oscillospiraceae bacterium]
SRCAISAATARAEEAVKTVRAAKPVGESRQEKRRPSSPNRLHPFQQKGCCKIFILQQPILIANTLSRFSAG